MNNNNLAPSTPPVNDICCNRHPTTRNRECPDCRYAVYPATGRCTNQECPQHERETGGALTVAELLREYAPPALFHGKHWGDWTLDTERLCLVYRAFPVALGDGSGRSQGVPPYTAFWGDYEIDIERIRDSAAMLDWIFQIRRKGWATARVMRDLIEALNDIFEPQANLCSAGCNKRIGNPKKFLRSRIVAVGSTDGPLRDAA
jgi:hypothetical protein